MAELVELKNSDREYLKRLLDTLGLKQRDIADSTKINQSLLSQILGGKIARTNKVTLKEIAEFLTNRIRSLQVESKITESQVLEAAGFLSQFSNAAEEMIPAKIFPPGEIVPVNAANYVERNVDAKVLEAFHEQPFTLHVSGPAQTGKSSLLARLESKAIEKGVETLWFDPKKEIPYDASKITSQAELNKLIVESLASAFQTSWKLLPPQSSEYAVKTVGDLNDWLKESLMPTRYMPRLLIIDDLGRLGMTAVEYWLRRFVRELVNERGRSGATESLNIAVGVSYGHNEGINTAALLISSLVTWTTEITTEWFDKDAVSSLSERLRSGLPASRMLSLFGGHPYLTNVALQDKDFFGAVSHWDSERTEKTARPIRGSKAYKILLNASRRAILGPSWETVLKVNDDVLRSLYKVNQDKKSGIRHDHKKFLVSSRFLREDNTPTISIYRLIAEDLYEELEP